MSSPPPASSSSSPSAASRLEATSKAGVPSNLLLVTPGAKKAHGMMAMPPGPPPLLSRSPALEAVKAFLPRMAEANAKLPQQEQEEQVRKGVI